MESMIAVGLLGIVASSTLFAIVSSNKFVVSQRYVSNAKALCQERIDQALIYPFPPAATDTFFGNWGTSTTSETLTQTEPNVPIYTTSDSGATMLVQGTRRTWVTRFTPNAADPAFVYARIRVRVEFDISGRGINNRRISQGGTPFSYEMTTLRSPD